MPYSPFQTGAPAPTQGLFGNAGGPLDILQRMLAESGVQPPQQPQTPPQPARPDMPARSAGPVDPVVAELDAQVRADPVAQQHIGDPNYEDLLKAELVKQLENDNDPGRAIQKALAAAGAAISGGQDVWQGISTGVQAYHGVRDDPEKRIGALKSLSDMDAEKADRPYRAQERAADLEAKRALAEERRSRAKYGPLERGQKEAQRSLDNRIKIDNAVNKLRDTLADDFTMSEEEKAAEIERYRQDLEAGQPDAMGATPEAAQLQTDALEGPAGGEGQVGEFYTNPETGQVIYWNGREWADWQTGQPLGAGG